MSDIKLCRICINQNVKMYKLSEYHIASYYEDLMNIKVNNDCIWFCFECAMMLQKFHKFKQKCHRGQNALKQLASAGHLNPAVYQSIRKNNNLESNYQLISISTNDRVKSYASKHTEGKISLITPDCMNNYNINNIQEQKELCMAAEPMVVLERVKIENQCPVIVFEPTYDEEPNESIHTDEEKHSSDDEINDNNKGIIAQQSLNEKEFVTKIVSSIEIKKKDTDSTEKIKFQRSVKKKFLDSNNWKKIIMTDNDVEREFKMKAASRKYLLADIKCTLCYKLFSQTDMLNRHMKLRHCKSIGAFECRYCRMRFKRKSRMNTHLKQHYTRYKCLRCEHSFLTETSAFAHDEYHNGVQQICPHCGKTFRHSSTYYTHLRTHRSNIVCTVCGETFFSEMGLKMHKKVKHVLSNNEPSDAEQNTYCERCDIKFENLSAYERHLAQSAKHTDIVDNSDNGVDSAPLFKHPLTTPRIRPMKNNATCSECGKTFPTYGGLTKHHSEEHPHVPLSRPPHKQYQTCTERVLCEICGASILETSLYSHMNTHMRTKMYTCEICKMTFPHSTSLARHKVTHTGERPYPCPLCEKRFTQRNSMQLHYRTFHLKEPYPKRNRQKIKEKEVSTAR